MICEVVQEYTCCVTQQLDVKEGGSVKPREGAKLCDARDKCKEVLRLEWRTNRADRSAAVVCLASGIIIISWEADAGNSVSWLGVYLYIENIPETERWILLNKIVAPCLSSGIAYFSGKYLWYSLFYGDLPRESKRTVGAPLRMIDRARGSTKVAPKKNG
ncbi:hypothetical protein TESG_07984 [Trichophyton tonsurans CBS 112818]|uniref:Uncharacterized protein n=1 Tax=Trichophyton tonsurans (strain CBS 112818) TaxID=647933 RepID=F2SAT8_TRIT1|nr:hypothetical protein TESG_07984 [Trichophyton tonsurans CBS 112818]